eukprot:PhF_6_TR8500/c0_g1_i3/m.13300
MSEKQGKLLGAYRLSRHRLKTCTNSKVYLATKEGDPSKHYAIKVYKKDDIVKNNLTPYLKRMLQDLKQVPPHPCLTTFYEMLQTVRHIYLVLELVLGKELFECMEEKPEKRFQNEEEAAVLAYQIALGVRHCHTAGVAFPHHGFTAEQILVSDSGSYIKLTGLTSLSCTSREGPKLMPDVCDSGYLNTFSMICAPEISFGETPQSPMSNVWSFGIITYAMVTGTYAFLDSSNVQEILEGASRAEYRRDPRMSPALQYLMENIFVKLGVGRRYTLDDVLASPWVMPTWCGPTPYDNMSHVVKALYCMNVVNNTTMIMGGKEETVLEIVPFDVWYCVLTLYVE